MDRFSDMVVPPVTTPIEEGTYSDYFGQRIRGSEVIPSAVQHYGDFDGQQSGCVLCEVCGWDGQVQY